MSFGRAAVVVVGVVLLLVLYNSAVWQTATGAPLQTAVAPAAPAAPAAPPVVPAAVPAQAPSAVGDPAGAQRIALDRVGGGTVTKTELDSEDGRGVWEIDVVKGATRHEVKIDDVTGTVLSTEIEDGPGHRDCDD